MSDYSEQKNVILPMMVVKQMTMIPGAIIRLNTNEKDAVATINKAMDADKRLFLVTERDKNTGEPYIAGTISEIEDASESQGIHNVTFRGIIKARINEITKEGPVAYADVTTENREVMQKEAENDPALATAR